VVELEGREYLVSIFSKKRADSRPPQWSSWYRLFTSDTEHTTLAS